jgi:ribosomal protein L24E
MTPLWKIAGVVAILALTAWRRHAKRRQSPISKDVETAERHQREQFGVTEALRRAAAQQGQAERDDIADRLMPTQVENQTKCDYCGSPLSPENAETIYRRFEGGAFHAFCSARCHAAFVERRAHEA